MTRPAKTDETGSTEQASTRALRLVWDASAAGRPVVYDRVTVPSPTYTLGSDLQARMLRGTANLIATQRSVLWGDDAVALLDSLEANTPTKEEAEALRRGAASFLDRARRPKAPRGG